MWSWPTPAQESEGEPFFPAESLVGPSLPENLLGGGASLDSLGQLFNSRPELWRNLMEEQEGLPFIRRDLDNDGPALLLSTPQLSDERRRWKGLYTSLAREARLLCYTSDNGAAVTTTGTKADPVGRQATGCIGLPRLAFKEYHCLASAWACHHRRSRSDVMRQLVAKKHNLEIP
jgi:hypothetical protein